MCKTMHDTEIKLASFNCLQGCSFASGAHAFIVIPCLCICTRKLGIKWTRLIFLVVKYAEHKFYHLNHCEGYSSVAWSAFTLCNHPQNSSYHPRLTLCTSVPISFISLSLQLLVTAVLLSFSMNLTTVDTTSKILQYSSFCVQLISLSLMSTSHTYMVACIRIPFPLTLNNVPLYVSITFYSSIIRGWTFGYCG